MSALHFVSELFKEEQQQMSADHFVMRSFRALLTLLIIPLLLASMLAFALGPQHARTAFAAPANSVDIVPGAAMSDVNRGLLIQAHGGGITQVGSTYYWFGEDKTGENSSDAYFQNVTCYASTDLVNWTFVNNVLTRQVSGDLGPDRIVERPKVIYNSSTAQYVMYMHIDNPSYSEAKVGVATSSTICGNYTYRGSFQPLGYQSRDMSLFKDSDGTAYLLSEDRANGLRIDKLSADYLSVVSSVAVLADYEAPAMFKSNGVYYLLGSHLTGWNTNDNQYTTATSLAGPWSSWSSFAASYSNTFNSQTTFVLPVTGSSGTTFMFMGDRWIPSDLSDSPYIWLPLTVSGATISMQWHDSWSLNISAGTWQNQISNKNYEAEASSNTLAGGAAVSSCTGCSGGQDVTSLGRGGTLQFNGVTPSSSGQHSLKIWYTNGDSTPRSASLSVNGGTPVTVSFPPTGGTQADYLAVTTITLQAGSNTIRVSNASAAAPNIDLIAIPALASDTTTYYKLVNSHSGDVLDTSSGAKGAGLVQNTYTGSTTQLWRLVFNLYGYYKLTNESSGYLVEVPNSSTTTGTQLDQWDDNGGNNQQWRMTLVSGSVYTFTNRNSGLLMEVKGQSTSNGGVVDQWSSNGGTNQQWQLVGVA